MKELVKSFLGIALVWAIAFLIGCGYGRKTARNKPETPIISMADTSSSVKPIEVGRPKIKDSTVIHHVWVRVPIVPDKADSVPDKADSVPDSALIDVPIERKIYEEDSLYRAVVSGPRFGQAGPSLDSLMIYSKTTTITVTNTVPETIFVPSRKKWSFGVTAGPSVLATRSGSFHAGIGITAGLSYRF